MTPADLLKQFELKPSKDEVALKYNRLLWQARFSSCGKFLIGCSHDASIQRWDFSAEEARRMPPLLGHSGWVQAMDFADSARKLVTADSWGRMICWEYESPDPKSLWNLPDAHDGWIRAIAVSPDNKWIASGGNSKTVRLWSIDGKLQKELPHPHRVYSLRFHPNGKSLVSGDLEGIIREWDFTAGKVNRQFDGSTLYADEAKTKGRIQQCGGIRHLQFDSTGKHLACSGQKTPGGGFATGTPCVLVFDWGSGKLVREMPMGGTQDGFAYDAQFHPDGFVMATSSAFPGKGHIWFWRPEDDQAFFSSTKFANGFSLSLHPDGKRIAQLKANAPNANGRPLKDGEYLGGSAEIRILTFPT